MQQSNQFQIITIEPETREDYEAILKDLFGSSWEADIATIGVLMDYKKYVGDLKGHSYSEVLDATWDL